MNHTSHSPGPWRMIRSRADWAIYSHNQFVAMVDASETQSETEGEANACLIAAATELLEIARLYAADLIEAGMNDGPRFRQVESVIEKATSAKA